MIVCDITNAHRVKGISKPLDMAIDWLQAHKGEKFEKGIIKLDPDGRVTVKCEEPHMRTQEVAELEAHRRYIDIHVPLKSNETIGWASVDRLKYPHGDYDEERDIIFFGDSATCRLHLRVGQMAVFFPEDAHAPNIGIGTHKKLCVKVAVE
ncbi:MAG: YhcH/YjgK/YiaL family protein [Muribaculaceae bacterium]|nr:YhcH/YjgK/YiaL family protein [Muribaculaceae bacterium]